MTGALLAETILSHYRVYEGEKKENKRTRMVFFSFIFNSFSIKITTFVFSGHKY